MSYISEAQNPTGIVLLPHALLVFPNSFLDGIVFSPRKKRELSGLCCNIWVTAKEGY